MSQRELQQALDALKQGRPDVSARILKILLRDGELDPPLQAIAYLALARTTGDLHQQIDYLQRAKGLDPLNQRVIRDLADALARQVDEATGTQPAIQRTGDTGIFQRTQPTGDTGIFQRTQPTGDTGILPRRGDTGIFQRTGDHTPTPAPVSLSDSARFARLNATPVWNESSAGYQAPPNAPAAAQSPLVLEVQRSVGIRAGRPNARVGSGVFVHQQGIIATTRTLIGDVQELEVSLLTGHRLTGKVLRSFPKYDLAFIHVPVQVQLPALTNVPFLNEDTPLVITPHQSSPIRTLRRATPQAHAPYWFPTELKHLPDGGGAPVFNLHTNALVGIITTNRGRQDGFYVGLHVVYVQDLLMRTIASLSQHPSGTSSYCPACGMNSNAQLFNAHYCPACGAVLPYAQYRFRAPIPAASALYGEHHAPCPHCQATTGFDARNRCLRCGKAARI